MSKRVLIIDDDKKLLELLTEYLSRFGYEPVTAATPELGLALLRAKQPEAVVLDVMLPGKDGFEVCKEIRRESDVPIVMLTARGDVTDRIVGLELGADDYLPKPFEPRELVARLGSILRRSGESKTTRLVFGALVIDPLARSASINGQPLELSTSEFDVLHLLATHPGRAFNRDQIMDKLRGTDWAAYNRSVDVLVSRLRQKLGDDPRQPKYVKTIWGTGYGFIAKSGGSDADG